MDSRQPRQGGRAKTPTAMHETRHTEKASSPVVQDHNRKFGKEPIGRVNFDVSRALSQCLLQIAMAKPF